jgi:hypothetical protein
MPPKNVTVKKTYREVITFINVAADWIKRNENKHEKFRYALTRVLKKAEAAYGDYQERLKDINVDHASVDDDGNCVPSKVQGETYAMTPDKTKARNAAVHKLLASTPVDVEPYYATEVPPDLKPEVVDAFDGFVLKADEHFADYFANPEVPPDAFPDLRVQGSKK